MSKLTVEDTSLVAVADAIRTKGGTTNTLVFPDGFVDAIGNIQSGGGVGGIKISINRYQISTEASWASTKKAHVYETNAKDFSLLGNMNVKVSNGYVPNTIGDGTTYYKTISASWDDVITSIFGDILPDGKYQLWYMLGNGKFNLKSTSISISNGTTNTNMSVQAYASSNTYKYVYLYLIGISKTE